MDYVYHFGVKILVIHSRYSTANMSGENRVVEEQVNFFRSQGFEVFTHILSTNELLNNRFYKLFAFLRVALSFLFDKKLLAQFGDIDLIILHNTFPNIGTGWLTHCKIPVIRFIHNYRDICANGLLFRDGKDCFLCPQGDRYASLRYKCYRDSFIATLSIFAGINFFKNKSQILKPAIHVTVSEFQSKIFSEFSHDKRNFQVLKNYANPPKNIQISTRENTWVSLGRLSHGKGFLQLIQNWPSQLTLEIIGDGELRDDCEQYIKRNFIKNIHLRGYLPPTTISVELPKYFGGIIPSLTKEPAPLVFGEFIAAQLPVIGLKNTFAGEEISKFGCGIAIEKLSHSDLENAINQIISNRSNFATKSYSTFQNIYAKEIWQKNLLNLLSQVKS